MKQCRGCHKEIDKYAIACEYCGKLNEERERPEANHADKQPENKDGENESK